MKNLKFLFLIAFSTVLFRCEKEQLLTATQIPAPISGFLAKHFPEKTIVRIEKDHDSYEVNLSENTSVDFNLSFEPTSIESRSKLPDTVIPAEILQYVVTNFPNNYITEWERELTGQKIELNNGKELSFALDGTHSSATIPLEIKAYLEKHFSTLTVLKFEKDHDSYEVDLSGNTSVDFDLNFEPTSIESNSKLPDTVIPAHILEHIKTNFPNNYITEWERERTHQKVELNNGKEISFAL